MKQESLSRITYNLYARNYIFNYATQYAQKRDSIGPINEFKFSQKDYEDFKEYLKDNNFEYITESEEALIKLKAIINKENFKDSLKAELNVLSVKIKHNKWEDLGTYKDEITELLQEEIASRYYYQRGRIQISLTYDPLIKKCNEILNDKKVYLSILNITSTEMALNNK